MSSFVQEPLVAGFDALASLRSSILDYVYENGRRYHRYAEGHYLLPNDEIEQERLDLHHHIFLVLLQGRLHLAPISNPKHILDVGTGTGIWAQDMAELYPDAEVVGTDLSAIQPTWVLPNCTFVIDDVELDWTWEPGYFDFIHARNLGQSIKDWDGLVRQMFEHTAPGGWVELAELNNTILSDDNSIPPDSSLSKLIRLNCEGFEIIGLKTPNGDELRQLLENAGYVDVEIHDVKQALGPWSSNPKHKMIGELMILNCETALEAYTLALFTRVLGMSTEEVQKLCRDALEDLKNSKIHAFNKVYYAIGRKPGEDMDSDSD